MLQQHHRQARAKIIRGAGRAAGQVRHRSLFRYNDREREPEEPEIESTSTLRELSAMDMEFYDGDLSAFIDEEAELAREEAEQEEEEMRRNEEQQRIREELDTRTGRGWSDPWELTDEILHTTKYLDEVPDWQPSMASRISLDRVQIYPDGIPSFADICELSLAPPPPAHPGKGDAKSYVAYRKQALHDQVAKRVEALAQPRIVPIERLPTWEEKQDAIDELFESIEFQLKEEEEVLGKHPQFGEWVETSLEAYLERIQQPPPERQPANATGRDSSGTAKTGATAKPALGVPGAKTGNKKLQPGPVFIDLYDEEDGEDVVVPSIVKPIKVHHRNGVGRMVEEWELAGHSKTKRIMLRQSTQEIAKALISHESPRVFVTGDPGVGKTADLVTIVASARKSGKIVLYLPDGDRLRRHGFFIEHDDANPGMFHLPVLAQEICQQLMDSHESDLEGMTTTAEMKAKFVSQEMFEFIPEEFHEEMTLTGLMKIAAKSLDVAGQCYSIVMEELLAQSEKEFMIVMDEFNCYFDKGDYFHLDYDEEVEKPIPLDRIYLFRPLIDAAGLGPWGETGPSVPSPTAGGRIKKGAMVLGISESRAISRALTDRINEIAIAASKEEDSPNPLTVVKAHRYSITEVDHILANFDTIGIGRLRFDRGATVMKDSEVAYLRMLSGAVGQKLLDVCIV